MDDLSFSCVLQELLHAASLFAGRKGVCMYSSILVITGLIISFVGFDSKGDDGIVLDGEDTAFGRRRGKKKKG